jgi:putative PIN family toxin of toxin-antitoxin system
MLRVVLDVSIFISYLLTPYSSGAAVEVIYRGWKEEFTMLISDPLMEELRDVATTSEYVGERVDSLSLQKFLRELVLLGEQVDFGEKRIWPGLRDADDAYLLEMAVVGEADCLVSGDKGFLEMAGRLPGLHVVTPARFLAMLEGTQ